MISPGTMKAPYWRDDALEDRAPPAHHLVLVDRKDGG
jgi:hypothetical protein